jgi:hypothetical protein
MLSVCSRLCDWNLTEETGQYFSNIGRTDEMVVRFRFSIILSHVMHRISNAIGIQFDVVFATEVKVPQICRSETHR